MEVQEILDGVTCLKKPVKLKPLPPPEVSVIIVSLNQSAKTIKCFQSIRATCSLPREIIWVDNGSKTDEFAMMRRAATRPRMRCKLIKHKHNVGFIQGVNSAIPEIDKRSKYVVLLNNDTEVGPDTFKKLVRPFEEDPKTGLTSCITQSQISWQTAEHLNRRWPELGLPYFKEHYNDLLKYSSVLAEKFAGKVLEVTNMNIAFFCACFRKEVFVDEMGGLDKDFGIGLAEDDYANHFLRHRGYKSYLALDAFVFHHHRTTFKALRLSLDSIRRSNLKVLKTKIKQLDNS